MYTSFCEGMEICDILCTGRPDASLLRLEDNDSSICIYSTFSVLDRWKDASSISYC